MKLGKVIKVVRVADVEDGDALETSAGAATLAEPSTDYAQAKELVN